MCLLVVLLGDSMRNCGACGAPLQPIMTFCPNCGRLASASHPNQTATDADDRTVAAPPAPQATLNAQRSVAVSGPPHTGYDNVQAYPQQALQAHSSQVPYTPPFSTNNQSGDKRLPKGTVALLTAMALLMMVGGVALIYYTAVAQPSQFRAQATATVQNTATSGTPRLTSSLAFQDGANWDVYNAVGGGGCGFTGGALHASIFVQHTYAPCFAQASNFSNFAFQVQMTILKGDGGGLVFRADDANAKFYLFRITHDGLLTLLVTSDSKTNTPLVDDTSPAIKKGAQTNLVTIIARGSNIYMYVNKQYVGSTSDSSYSSGKIGVFADDTGAATDVAFSNAQVWQL